MRPQGTWGPKEFAQFTEDELHETMMGAQPGSNYFEWAKAELEHRDRKRSQAEVPPSAASDSAIQIHAETAGANVNTTAESLRGRLKIEKTVFISYRRRAVSWAQAIYVDLTHHGYDVFFDYANLASGDFAGTIIENIRARAHFVVLITPTALERCNEPTDLFRREIEAAIESKRNIVPIMLDDFTFNAQGVDDQLGVTLAALKGYNGIPFYASYFSEGMERLRDKFLNVPLDTVLHPASPSAHRAAKEDQAAANQASQITTEILKEGPSTSALAGSYPDVLTKRDPSTGHRPG